MTDSSPESHEPAAHYDRIHEAWTLIMGPEFHYGYFANPDVPLGEATAELTAHMLRRARIAAGDRVLDVGCGTGRQACDLAAQYGADVLGITTSASGVAAATHLAAQRGLRRVRFEQRDGTNNGLPDGSFDVVWALESSHLMRARRRFLGESARVLAPGGRIVLCDIVRRREIPFLEVRDRRADFAVLRAAFGDAHMEPLDSYTAMLDELGMETEDATDITGPTLPTFAAWRSNVEAHEEALRSMMGPAAVADFVRATHILEQFWHDGTLGYGILTAAKTQ